MSEMTMAVIGSRGGRSVSVDLMAGWVEYGPAPMIIDIRERRQFETGSIAEAVNIPCSDSRELTRRIPSDGLAVLVCEDGTLSREVVRMLECCGLRQTAYLDGGMKAWKLRLRRLAA